MISGVGHETDFTLSDFAADLRAPTPTAAAELATQTTVAELRQKTGSAAVQLGNLVMELLGRYREDTASAIRALHYYSPARRIQSDRQRLDDLARRVPTAQSHLLALLTSDLDGWHQRLLALNPIEVLKRGYAIVTRRSDGTLIRRVVQARGGIHVRLADGGFEAEVTERRA